jgi:hypothetical protein
MRSIRHLKDENFNILIQYNKTTKKCIQSIAFTYEI